MAQTQTNYGVAVWDIVFVPGPRSSWYDWLSPSWCRHVMAYGYAYKVGAWVIVNPTEKFTMVDVLPEKQFERWRDRLLEQDPTVVRAPVVNETTISGRFGLFCTAAVKHLIGLRSRALRPVALYRDLIASGATKVIERDGYQSERPG